VPLGDPVNFEAKVAVPVGAALSARVKLGAGEGNIEAVSGPFAVGLKLPVAKLPQLAVWVGRNPAAESRRVSVALFTVFGAILLPQMSSNSRNFWPDGPTNRTENANGFPFNLLRVSSTDEIEEATDGTVMLTG
jgi:hypothetical protein